MARRLVRLYPRAWRERYEEEFVAMLEHGPASARELLDVTLGALDAWLMPQVASERSTLVFDRMRSSVLVVLWAWVGLVVAGVGFQKMTEYEDFVRAARDNALLGAAFDAVVIGAVVALVAVTAGGALVAFAAVRKAFAEGRKDVPLLFCVPLFSGAAFVGYTLVLVKIIYPALGRLAANDAVNVTLFLSLAETFVLAAVASAGAVSVAVRRSEIGDRPLRFALIPAVVAALAMVVVSVGTVAWGLALRAQSPTLFAGDDGILSTSTAATWFVIVAMMCVSACVAVAAAIRGLRVRNAEHTPSRH
jgi:hypothetical protein